MDTLSRTLQTATGDVVVVVTVPTVTPYGDIREYAVKLFENQGRGIGTLLLVSGMGFTAYSEQTVASGLVVAYIAIIPIIVTAMNLPFGVKPTRLELVGMLVGVAGVLMLVQGQAFTASPVGLVAITIALGG